MTKEIRREIVFLNSQESTLDHNLWANLINVLEKIADRIDQLEAEKVTKRGI